ncbi:hypothetical protein ONE63_003877 [Megalurothrips usitatus]|uniref:Glutathione S-transferase 1-like n=1 Tax=Megalurothrips usitatus TaxID=439358 RepID=A0AAV7X4F0_9NEOP|nr:hypothetical protein ONE63_003877 [Megalurothrips usitatus]
MPGRSYLLRKVSGSARRAFSSTSAMAAPREPIKLHGFTLSPPFRASAMTCEVLGIEYKTQFIDVTSLEHRKPAYLKLNPLHSIPTMEDGDYILYDSHAISAYLCNMYGKDNKWYPTDPRQRGIVDQRLHFDCSVLGPSFKNMAIPLLFGKQIQPKMVEHVKESMQQLDKLLGDRKFIALDWPTIADCHCSSTVISIQVSLISISSNFPTTAKINICFCPY